MLVFYKSPTNIRWNVHVASRRVERLGDMLLPGDLVYDRAEFDVLKARGSVFGLVLASSFRCVNPNECYESAVILWTTT